uniref:VWFA domain-containing protein n=1 Tax=Sphenodon punctatus TaxID=8508 RepID=A0A8D0GEF1_SPHPU
MVKEASAYLFNATKQRFYFKSVKILIPRTWGPKSEYLRARTESYDKADVIVATATARPFLKKQDEPYTLQYEGCGKRGRYIHFTPNFLLNDTLLDDYGPRGRTFVHEWAHLRWGVYDEYNDDAPFYVSVDSGKTNVKATRCSADIRGRYRVQDQGTQRPCKYDHRTNLYEAGCKFLPYKRQSTPASIMYMQNLPSVVEFCNSTTHNGQATNMQNKVCDYQSTWDVIRNSTDFASSSPITGPPPEPNVTLLQAQGRVVCLVLDVSGSMDQYNRINRLRQAAELFLLQIIETGSWAGIVTFSSAAQTQSDLRQIVDESVRKLLTNLLPTTAGGGTSICAGVHQGFQQNAIDISDLSSLKMYNNTYGSEIVLLTDGEDSAVSSCFDEVRESGSIIHAIALGPSADPRLNNLADMTGMFNVWMHMHVSKHTLCHTHTHTHTHTHRVFKVQVLTQFIGWP